MCDDGGASRACIAGCSAVRPGWRCSAAGCIPGPAEVAAPAPATVEAAAITWRWEAPNSLGSPVLYYLCVLAPALDGSGEANWTAAALLNATPAAAAAESAAKPRQRLGQFVSGHGLSAQRACMQCSGMWALWPAIGCCADAGHATCRAAVVDRRRSAYWAAQPDLPLSSSEYEIPTHCHNF